MLYDPVVPIGPPSAPVNVISSVNGTSVSLEWGSPLDMGGRTDIIYDVQCKRCVNGGQCEDCSAAVGGTGSSISGAAGGAVGAFGSANSGLTGTGGSGGGMVSRTGRDGDSGWIIHQEESMLL